VSTETAIFQVGHLERAPLGTSYPAIAHHVRRLLLGLPRSTEVVLDATGLGGPVFDIFVGVGISPVGVMITAGTSQTQEGKFLHVSKMLLISRVQALLHEGRLKIQKNLPEASVLMGELLDYRIQYTAAGHLTFNAREGRHDDLVLALAMACYRAAGDGVAYEGLLDYYRRLAAPAGIPSPRYFVGVDLGQARDPTAIAVVRRVDYPSPAEVRDPQFVPDPAAEAAA
jgi:hypothetical protein